MATATCVCGLKSRRGFFQQGNCSRLKNDDFLCYNCIVNNRKCEQAIGFLEKEIEGKIMVLQNMLSGKSQENNVFDSTTTDLNDSNEIEFHFSFMELWRMNDVDFVKLFHMSRESVVKIIDILETVNENFIISTNNISEKTEQTINKVKNLSKELVFLVCLWYLVNRTDTLEECAQLFRIDDIEEFNFILDRGFDLISKLKDNTVKWPCDSELGSMADVIAVTNNNKRCVGVLGVFGSYGSLLLFGLSCGDLIFHGVHVEESRVPVDALLDSDLYNKISSLPDNYYIVCDEGPLTGLNEDCLLSHLVPYKKMEPSKQAAGAGAMTILVNCWLRLEGRFPRIGTLHRSIPNALLSAVVLHNLCVSYNDVFVENFSELDMDATD